MHSTFHLLFLLPIVLSVDSQPERSDNNFYIKIMKLQSACSCLSNLNIPEHNSSHLQWLRALDECDKIKTDVAWLYDGFKQTGRINIDLPEIPGEENCNMRHKTRSVLEELVRMCRNISKDAGFLPPALALPTA